VLRDVGSQRLAQQFTGLCVLLLVDVSLRQVDRDAQS